MTAANGSPDELGIRWVASSVGPRLVVGPSSAVLRQELGPVAWSTLETLALAAEPTDDGRLIATLNARQVAAALGVGREAAGKAIAVLRQRELIVFEQSRRDGGHFMETRYTVQIALLTEPELRQDRATRRAPRASTPTLFDNSNADVDDDAREASSSHDVHDTNGTRISHLVAPNVPEISHTLALSMPTHGESGGARC